MSGAKFDHALLAFDAVEQFDRLQTPEEVVAHMRTVLGQFGYSGFLITNTPEVAAAQDRQTLIDGWPDDFNGYYIEKNFYKDDPIAARCRQTFGAFEWKDVLVDRKDAPRSLEVMGAASEVGLRQGFSIPVYRAVDVLDTVSMAGERPDFDPTAKRAVTLIGLYAHAKTMALMAKAAHERPKKLSDAEREAMTWVAIGKTSGEIATILGVSESAVIKRIDHAMKKLNSVTRAQATANALIAREIKI